MYQYILTAHILLGLATLSFSMIALSVKTNKNMIRYVYLITTGLSLEVISGTYMAILSTEITALSMCKNLVAYSIIVISALFITSLRINSIKPKQYMSVFGTLCASYSTFIFILIMGY